MIQQLPSYTIVKIKLNLVNLIGTFILVVIVELIKIENGPKWANSKFSYNYDTYTHTIICTYINACMCVCMCNTIIDYSIYSYTDYMISIQIYIYAVTYIYIRLKSPFLTYIISN